MTYYLMDAASGAPALTLTFDTQDAATDACVEHFGVDALNSSVLIAGWDDDNDAEREREWQTTVAADDGPIDAYDY